jgi:acetyl-CoA carboxylase carboxyl transferase subunit beta
MPSIAEWFSKRTTRKKFRREDGYKEYAEEKLDIPGSLWIKCYKCGETLYNKDLEQDQKVCKKCGYHFKLTFQERLNLTLDERTFVQYDANIKSKDFLNFVDSKPYAKRIEESMQKSGLNEAVVTGEGDIGGYKVIVAVMDFSFMGGSVASAVGEKITRAVEKALKRGLPVIIFTSSGGMRMQEGIMSLMQMAKTAAALEKLAEQKLPLIVVLTDPTTGGTTASYAMLGDVHLAEPGALIGFAGPRVIEQTIRQKLPKGFQRAEYLLEHGMVDVVVERKDIKNTIIKLLRFFVGKG